MRPQYLLAKVVKVEETSNSVNVNIVWYMAHVTARRVRSVVGHGGLFPVAGSSSVSRRLSCTVVLKCGVVKKVGSLQAGAVCCPFPCCC